MTTTPNPQIQTLKYQIYYGWGTELFTAKKYQSASDKTAMAIAVNRSTEAVALKTKISNAASVRNYDAEISDILESVDALLARGDLTGAQDAIQTNLPKLKIQANKNSLSAKKDAINSQLKKLYQDGIALYNEEDYEGALQKFRIVVKVNSAYEQAQAYVDRSTTKVRALTGKD